ncbi:TPM domain-containing protein [Candidatus Gracilibacteria bacterium]|nr:TPM domain-containing protein [Candidatus Gracilibacteria bacterium]
MELLSYITDIQKSLAQSEYNYLNQKLSLYDIETGEQIIFILLSKIDQNEVDIFAQNLIEKYNIGYKSINTGVICIFSIDDKNIFIIPNKGLALKYNDVSIRNITKNIMIYWQDYNIFYTLKHTLEIFTGKTGRKLIFFRKDLYIYQNPFNKKIINILLYLLAMMMFILFFALPFIGRAAIPLMVGLFFLFPICVYLPGFISSVRKIGIYEISSNQFRWKSFYLDLVLYVSFFLVWIICIYTSLFLYKSV